MKKDREIKVITHNGAKVPLMFNPNSDSLEFYVKIGSEIIKGTDSRDVQRRAMEYLDQTTVLKWTHVIDIQNVGSSYERSWQQDHKMRHSFGFMAERYHVTLKPNCDPTKLDWELFDGLTDAERLNRAGHCNYSMAAWIGKLPHYESDSHRIHWRAVIPYDEDVWVGLTSLWDSFTKLEEKVVGLFTSDTGLQKLRLVALAKQLQLTEGGGE